MNDDQDRQQTPSAGTAAGVARRSLLGGLAAGILAVTGLELAEAKKGGKGKGRGRSKGKGKGRGKGQGQGQVKVQICHKSGQKFTLISVSESAVPAHEAHGDVLCTLGVCQTAATGCGEDGACIFTQATPGDPCIDNGVDGTCTDQGICEPNEAP